MEVNAGSLFNQQKRYELGLRVIAELGVKEHIRTTSNLALGISINCLALTESLS